jgi:hypothetical protein
MAFAHCSSSACLSTNGLYSHHCFRTLQPACAAQFENNEHETAETLNQATSFFTETACLSETWVLASAWSSAVLHTHKLAHRYTSLQKYAERSLMGFHLMYGPSGMQSYCFLSFSTASTQFLTAFVTAPDALGTPKRSLAAVNTTTAI